MRAIIGLPCPAMPLKLEIHFMHTSSIAPSASTAPSASNTLFGLVSIAIWRVFTAPNDFFVPSMLFPFIFVSQSIPIISVFAHSLPSQPLSAVSIIPIFLSRFWQVVIVLLFHSCVLITVLSFIFGPAAPSQPPFDCGVAKYWVGCLFWKCPPL